MTAFDYILMIKVHDELNEYHKQSKKNQRMI
jgi:hypothetical protein